MGRAMEIDPEGAILAFRKTLATVIAMPGRLMYDGKDPDLFEHFASIAQRSGAYTVRDYAQIIGHLVSLWGVAGRSVSGGAAKAQDYLCRQAERYAGIAERVGDRLGGQPEVSFAWIHGRKV